jgi:hypothetical protein
MGPVMAIFRPVAALVNAVGTGLLTTLVADEKIAEEKSSAATEGTGCCASKQPEIEAAVSSCCESESKVIDVITSCCSERTPEPSCCSEGKADVRSQSKVMQVLSYAGAELLDDISKWLAFGIVLAGIMLTFIPPDWLAQWGGGLTAMLVMLVVGVPMYICAVASTPVAAGFLLAGVSPGAVLVFLLVGPATNIASFALLKQELGLKVTGMYLFGLSVLSLAMGLLLEWLLEVQNWQIEASLGHAHAMLPDAVSWGSAFILIFLAIKPLRRAIVPQLG